MKEKASCRPPAFMQSLWSLERSHAADRAAASKTPSGAGDIVCEPLNQLDRVANAAPIRLLYSLELRNHVQRSYC